MQWNLLVIEDDKALSDGIRLALQDAQHRIVQVETLHAGKCCLEKMIETSGRGEQERIDLVILDLNLPDGNGLELLQWIRERRALPVIILTANDLEIDIVTGLESGADDYITKPFSLMVLRARVRARLRNMQGARPMENGQEQSIQIGPFSFAFDKMEYRKNGENLVLSRTEQKLLRILVENRGKTIPKERLLDQIWADGGEFVEDNALFVAIKRLREKLEDRSSSPEYIKNVYGIGYMWQETDRDSSEDRTWSGSGS